MWNRYSAEACTCFKNSLMPYAVSKGFMWSYMSLITTVAWPDTSDVDKQLRAFVVVVRANSQVSLASVSVKSLTRELFFRRCRLICLLAFSPRWVARQPAVNVYKCGIISVSTVVYLWKHCRYTRHPEDLLDKCTYSTKGGKDKEPYLNGVRRPQMCIWSHVVICVLGRMWEIRKQLVP